jgi:type I restriction-modification system DNA methylase subunit
VHPDTDALRTLFASPFSPGKWTEVLAGLFGVRQAADGQLLERPRPVAVPDAVGFFLGRFTTSDGYLVGLFRCEIAAGSVLRRRVGLRNLVHRYLGTDFDAALAVFTERGSGAWRFSFICDLKGEATAPKRFTYVFGVPGIPLRTPVGRFAALSASREPDRPVSMAAMRDAFSVEALSDEFFAAYKEHYETFVARITGKRFVKQGGKWVETATGRPDRDLYRTFGNDDKRVRDYVKKMLGRLVFLHFLQKKGWLGARGGGWTGGDPAFLLNLFEKATPAQQDDFLDGVLENLFFNALNTDRSARGDLFDTGVPGIGECRIPYLNGGLFERDGLDDLRVRFPAAYFRDLLRFFSEYNFTIDENDADEAEVGIDPEMLGRIFENLLEDNKDKGAFYTPKEIVRYMCRRSLLAHLSEGEKEKDAAAITAFLDTRDPTALPKPLAARLAAKLRDVKICDPAIGSGAFPMGLLRELHDLRAALEPAPPDLKRQIIENNIYGVDIEKGAVDIARLRFWLALVVDADSPTPLPNLDFKIMQGNSLVESWKGHDLSGIADGATTKKLPALSLPGMSAPAMQLTFFDEAAKPIHIKLRSLLHRWFACFDHKERSLLRKEIHAAVEDIFRGLGSDVSLEGIDPSANTEFFLWHLWFAEVFENGGFDIVIGNPPYVFARESKEKGLTTEVKKFYYDHFALAQYQINLYPLFIEQGTNLLRHNGIFAYIVPNNWLTINTNKELRKYILGMSDIQIVNFYKRVFESADVDSSIVLFRKAPDAGRLALCEATAKDRVDLIVETDAKTFLAKKDYVINGELFKNNSFAVILDKIEGSSVELKEIADVKCGLGAYGKHKGIPPQTESMIRNRIYHSYQKKGTDWFEYIEGEDVQRFHLSWRNKEYLKWGKHLREPRNNWDLFSSPRILVRQIPSKLPYCINACYTEDVILNDRNSMNVIYITENPIFVLGVLNSKAISFWFAYKFGKLQRGIFPQFKINELASFPIPRATDSEQKRIATLVDRILLAKAKDPDADTTSDERRIDELVYKLYDLTPEEIAMVDGSAS